MIETLASTGYVLAAAGFALLTILLLTTWRGRMPGNLLALACALSAAWAASQAAFADWFSARLYLAFLLEILFDGVWLLFLYSLLRGAVGTRRLWFLRYGGFAIATLVLAVGSWVAATVDADQQVAKLTPVLTNGSVVLALFGLVLLEQIFRNSRDAQQRGLKYLCVGIGCIFAYDLFLYSNAIVTGEISSLFWGVRGYVLVMCVPLIAIAAVRSKSWSPGIFVSRQMVFYTASIVGAGVYLTIIGVSGYYIRVFGGNLGPAAQLVFFFGAALAFVVLMLSEQVRARVKVLVNKHFFEDKYDYREEWLRLIGTLTSHDDTMSLRKRAILSLAQIIDAPAGQLWSKESDDTAYLCVASWNSAAPTGPVAGLLQLVEFLNETQWVIDVQELEEQPERYDGLELGVLRGDFPDIGYVVPLLHDGDLLGFVVLFRPLVNRTLNFEDRDLLKTAGQQIASYLAQEIATEKLAENRQFEAFNRLTAFIMHDLKNAIAQQSLVVENAEKHKRNPEFVDDAVEAIRGSVGRMTKVVEHLQQRSTEQPLQKLELKKLVSQVASQCGDRQPVPRTNFPDDAVWVAAHRDRLAAALAHAIRNAQDASAPDGHIDVMLDVADGECLLSVRDDGCGMEPDFVRERLFKPFDSTKGTQGMGIGAYQIRETVLAAGGDVVVESSPDNGTCLVLRLPLAVA